MHKNIDTLLTRNGKTCIMTNINGALCLYKAKQRWEAVVNLWK